MENNTPGRMTISYTALGAVWGALLALTWLTVRVAEMHLPGVSAASPFFIAAVKASLVIAFFMHLVYEGWFTRFIIGVSIVVMIVTAWLVYMDVAYRV